MKKASLALVALTALLSPPAWATGAASNSFVFNQLEITLDNQTGGLLRLAHPAAGVILETPPALGGLINVAYAGRSLEPAGSKAVMVRSADGVTITWAVLGGDLPDGKISAMVTFKAAPDGRSVILAAKVKNEARGTTTQVLFPDLKGLRPVGDPKAMELRMALGAVNPFGAAHRRGRACPHQTRAFARGRRLGGTALWREYRSAAVGFIGQAAVVRMEAAELEIV